MIWYLDLPNPVKRPSPRKIGKSITQKIGNDFDFCRGNPDLHIGRIPSPIFYKGIGMRSTKNVRFFLRYGQKF